MAGSNELAGKFIAGSRHLLGGVSLLAIIVNDEAVSVEMDVEMD
jgi:hypothetical protein